MIFFPDLPLHATSPSRWKWAAVSHRSLASWSIKRLSPPVQLLLVSMICTVPVIDQFCDSICKWFRIAQLAVSVCSQGFQFPAAIVDQLVHERWKNGIFHRSRLPRWRGRRNLIKIGEVSLSGGPSNQLDDKWSPFRSNGSFWKNERQTCIPAGSVVNGLGDGARCEVKFKLKKKKLFWINWRRIVRTPQMQLF